MPFFPEAFKAKKGHTFACSGQLHSGQTFMKLLEWDESLRRTTGIVKGFAYIVAMACLKTSGPGNEHLAHFPLTNSTSQTQNIINRALGSTYYQTCL